MMTYTGTFKSAKIGLLLSLMREAYPGTLESAGRGLTYPNVFKKHWNRITQFPYVIDLS